MKRLACLYIALGWLAFCGAATADVKSKAVQEAAEAMLAKFGAKAGKSSAALASRIEAVAVRHGEKDVLLALQKAGPSALGLIENAGVDGAKAVRVLARHGEAGATRVLNSPKGMSGFLRYGDDAASVLIKHPGVAEEMVERAGLPAVKALASVTPQNGRRIAMLLEGEIGKLGKHQELLEVIARYGDRAANFVWNNAGALSVAATLTVFLTHPEPFLDGVKDITKTAAESAVKPLAEIPTEAVKGIVSGTNWTVVVLAGMGVVTLIVLARNPGTLQALAGLFRKRPSVVPSNAPAAQPPQGESGNVIVG